MSNNPPKVRIAEPKNRPIQLRYTDPETKKEIRISTGSRDYAEAERQKRKLEAKLLLGIDAKPEARNVYGPNMSWELFREEYSNRYLSTLRPKSAMDAESRLNLIERILKPKILSDVANRDAMESVQSKLLAGEGKPLKKDAKGKLAKAEVVPRSPHTVKTTMSSFVAALNWACEVGWLDYVPKVRKVKTSKLRASKGRPLTPDEFKRMLNVTGVVVGKDSAESWRFLLRGLWSSALRLDEILNVSWTDTDAIRPIWEPGREPELFIPHHLQKNATEESIPLLPWFEDVLLEVPEEDRIGWVFNPGPVAHSQGRPPVSSRRNSDWVGKVISRIGKRAGIVVKDGNTPKHASAHDLRRSCSQRMMDSGVPPELIQQVMRHASFETTKRHYAVQDVQKNAKELRKILS